MAVVIEFPTGAVLRRTKYHLHENLGIEGSPNVAVIPCDRVLLPTIEEVQYFMVGKFGRDQEQKLFSKPIAYFLQLEIAQAFAMRISENYLLSLPTTLLKEMINQRFSEVPF